MRNLTKTFGGVQAVDGISFKVRKGETLGIIGPNGAGKSMLLKCLMGLYAPDAGHITRAPGLRIGYVPQRLVADHTMPISVRRFLQLRTRAHPEDITRVAEETGIAHVSEKPLHLLSGGELQRSLLARRIPAILKIFTVGVFIGDTEIAQGEGQSKQEAEQKAAEKALVVKGW